MKFKNLVTLVNELDSPKVPFKELRAWVNNHHAGVGIVNVRGIKYPTPNMQAFYRLIGESRTSAYEEAYFEVEICYCTGLDTEPRERRYAWTKELMHVFDAENERADTKEKFKTLLRDIQNEPLLEHASPMYRTDINTRWKAAIVLCPKKYRDVYRADYLVGKMEVSEIAEQFRVPEWIVPFVMDEYYDVAYNSFMK
jgi:hypothetical protein